MPPNLKLLRWLVTMLMVTMIAGFVVIVTLFVIRMPDRSAPPLPAQITLPEGATPYAITRGRDWLAVVTETDEILIFDSASGTLRQKVEITRQETPAAPEQRARQR
ncbi:DUF6476 family protein [Rhodovulum imhoffii]